MQRFTVLIGLIALLALLSVSCTRPTTPKPYGYFRISLPDHRYIPQTASHAQFAMNQAARVVYIDSNTTDFFNVSYPSLNSTIYCTYLPIENNLPTLLKDAQELVYSHAIKASAIPEQEYMDSLHRVYGMFFELQGNTATPVQFYLTDSTRHFFRGSVYINTVPNQDSLAPVIEYMVADTRKLMETFRWTK